MRVVILFFLSLLSSFSLAKNVTDILGRQVAIPDAPQRIVVGESRMLYTLALLDPDNPARHIVGWPGDMARYDAQSWRRYTEKFPSISRIPQLGNGNLHSMNAEILLPLKPDLVILPRLAKTTADDEQLLQTLTNAGVPVIYVDLRIDLLNNTLPSLRLLGEVLNQPERAAAFSEFYQRHMTVIRQRLDQYHGKKTTVMLHLHLGRRDTCCTTAVGGNLGELLAFAGGENIAAGAISSVYGELSPERVLAANPEVYIATGMAGPEGKRFSNLMLGPQVNPQQAQDSFGKLIRQDPLLSHLQAVRTGRAWSMWHNFYLSPYHMVMVEMFAKALYPDLFADIDPQLTMKKLYQDFLPIDYSGTYWSQLAHE
ncbi:MULTISPECIES: ABC transporter substrate-binding protein [unclassified Brenneria]|uniref:ABC transporter substrate-binding protein n=1 Tax=unclassified Brenneria TaxID=2634434 RepID=UPI0029C3BB93|nr:MULTISPECIES: ABC transporter substrate-binding protein [unclassified Brenneria]MDX5628181.1 ABC transporter substrate-binding protein [Brenneria sp. L3-3Z]MDX5694799.1 ABC transporter substrate-binding protein [Brenneria sp. L4-2C]MEE3660588.1 ABC transporter substrate-binding protein [Brenneria sp. g21c3]